MLDRNDSSHSNVEFGQTKNCIGIFFWLFINRIHPLAYLSSVYYVIMKFECILCYSWNIFVCRKIETNLVHFLIKS